MIYTDRLSLRRLNSEDENFIVNYLSVDGHAKYLPLARPYTENEALKWFNGRLYHWRKYLFGTFMVILEQLNESIGYCGIEYVRDTAFIDIRYGITKQFWGHGYAYEAALAVLNYGFRKFGFEKLCGAAVRQNDRSIRLIEKIGMTEDNQFHEYDGDVAHYAITIGEFNNIISERIASGDSRYISFLEKY